MNYYEELGKINKKINKLQRCKANCGSSGNAWSLTGNSDTDSASNFVGTTDGEPLMIKSTTSIDLTNGGANFLKLQNTPFQADYLYSSFGTKITDNNFNGFRFSSDDIGLYYTFMGQRDSVTEKGGFIEIENIGGDNAIECVTNNGNGGFESMLKQTPEQLTFGEYGGGKLFLDLDQETNRYRIGDLTNSNNGTSIQIDDALSLITITNVPSYADDAAASVAGLTTGQLYKTTTAGSTFLKIVP